VVHATSRTSDPILHRARHQDKDCTDAEEYRGKKKRGSGADENEADA
jgi:hypothetical protein